MWQFGVVVWDEPLLRPFSRVLVGMMSQFIALLSLPGLGAPGTFRFAAADGLATVLVSRELTTFTLEDRHVTILGRCHYVNLDEACRPSHDAFRDLAERGALKR